MTRIYLPFFICFILVLAGCSSTKNYHINPEYKQEKKSSSVLVVPIQGSWFKNNFTYTFGSLSGNGKEVFWSSLKPLLSSYLQSNVVAAEADVVLNADMFEADTLLLGKKKFEFMLPQKNSNFNFEGHNPDIVLLLDKYYYQKRKEMSGGNSYAGHEPKPKLRLYFQTRYIFWDTRNKQPVAWGTTDAATNISDGEKISYSEYRDVLSRALKKISEQGPVI